MEIGDLSINPPVIQLPADYSNLPAKVTSTTQPSEKSRTSLSPLAELAYSYDLRELTYSANETEFAYYKGDNSVAMRAHSITDMRLKQETVNLDLTFSAEALGLSAKDFADNGEKPITISFSYQQTEMNISHESSTRQVETTRKPDEVLTDLAKSVREVLKDRGNKSVSYVLDDAARSVLMGSKEGISYFMELVMIMAMINLQKGEGASNDYSIFVSGKGKPFIDREEKTQIDGKSTTINLSITINPPAESDQKVVESVSQQAPSV